MADWYVAPTGSDSTGTGAIGSPWLTVAGALAKAAVVAGDRLYLRAGTYVGFTVTKENITIEGYPGEAAVVQATGSAHLITFNGVTQGKLKNVTVIQQDTTANGTAVRILDCVNSPGVTIVGCRVTDAPQFGVRAYDSNYLTIVDNEVARCGVGIELHAHQEAGYEQNRGFGSRIERNWVHDIDKMIKATTTPTTDDYGAQGITFIRVTGTSSVPIVCRDNVVERCWAASPDYVYDGSGVEIFAASWLTITANIFRGCKNVLETGTQDYTAQPGVRQPVSHIVFTRNLCARDIAYPTTEPPVDYARGVLIAVCQDSLFAHNTVSGMDQFGFSIGGDPTNNPYQGALTNTVVKDNVIVAGPRATLDRCVNFWEALAPAGVVVNYNLYFHPAGASGQIAYVDFATTKGKTTLAQLQADTTYEDNGVQGDPLLAAAPRSLGLLASSPALSVAPFDSSLNAPYRGAGPDLGAIEGVTIAADAFLRTQVNSWGSADVGGTWSVSSATADYDVDHGVWLGGAFDFPSASSTKRARLASVSATAVDMYVAVRFVCAGADTLPVGANFAAFMVARMIDATDNMYYARAEFTTAGGINLGIVRREATVENALNVTAAPVSNLSRETAEEGAWYWWRFQVVGTSPTALRTKLWRMGTAEPSTWDREGADNIAAFQVASPVGLRAFRASGQTNAIVAYWDRFQATSDYDGLLVSLGRPQIALTAKQLSITFSGGGGEVIVPLGRPTFALVPRSVQASGLADVTVALGRPTFALVPGQVVAQGVQGVTLGRPTIQLVARPLQIFGVTGATEELIYDSGWITSATSDFTIPADVLDDDQHYRWAVDVEDAESLVGSLA